MTTRSSGWCEPAPATRSCSPSSPVVRATAELPDSLQRLGAALVDRLPAPVRAVVREASTFGSTVRLDVVADLLGRPELASAEWWSVAFPVMRTSVTARSRSATMRCGRRPTTRCRSAVGVSCTPRSPPTPLPPARSPTPNWPSTTSRPACRPRRTRSPAPQVARRRSRGPSPKRSRCWSRRLGSVGASTASRSPSC